MAFLIDLPLTCSCFPIVSYRKAPANLCSVRVHLDLGTFRYSSSALRSGEYVGPFETYPLVTPDFPTRFGDAREGEGTRFVVLWGELVAFVLDFPVDGRRPVVFDVPYLPVLGRLGDDFLVGELGVTMPLRLVGVVRFPVEPDPTGGLFFPAMGLPHPDDAFADPAGLLPLEARLFVVGLAFLVPPPPDFRLPKAFRIAFMVEDDK